MLDRKLLFSLILTFTFSFQTNAAALFGAEFTFTEDNLRFSQKGYADDPYFLERKVDLVDEILKRCDGCKIIAGLEETGSVNQVDGVKIIYPNGWWLVVNLDPGVVEIQTKPTTVKEFKKNKKNIQHDLFDGAKKLGLSPDREAGGGHIHIGLKSSFEEDPKLLLNFITDFFNHPELAQGIFEENDENSIPFIFQVEESKKSYRKLLEHFRSEGMSISEIGEYMHELVYSSNVSRFTGRFTPQKNHALNLVRMYLKKFSDEEKTVEIRSMRAQLNMEEFISEIELFEARIEMLKKEEGLLEFIEKPRSFLYNEEEIVKSFKKYVTDTGLPFLKYRKYLLRHTNYHVPSSTCKEMITDIYRAFAI